MNRAMTYSAHAMAAGGDEEPRTWSSRRRDERTPVETTTRTRTNPWPPVSRLMFVAVTVGILSSMKVVDACSMPRGWRPLSPVEKLLKAEHALYATVLRTIPDERFAYGGESTAYTAEIYVHCILKGQQTEQVVNITQAGHVPGLCHSTNLKVTQTYVVLVHLYDDEYHPHSGELAADTEEQINHLTVACGLQQVYPRGVQADRVSVKCPKIGSPSNCKSAKDFGTTPVAEVDDEYDFPIRNNTLLQDGYSTGNSWHCQLGTIVCLLSTVLIALGRLNFDALI